MKVLLTVLVLVLLGTVTGFAGEEVKVGSPFDLKLGSDELAVRHPKLLSRSHSVFTTVRTSMRCRRGRIGIRGRR